MAGERILLADDDPQMLALLGEFLKESGFEVTPVGDGAKAMEALKEQEYPLAILDLKLPGHSGLDLLSHIKATTPHTEVLLFTGHAGVDSAVQALRLGAYDYLLKSDLRLADLQAVVNRALERRRLARENRELLEHISRAQKELARRRAMELTQVRRIGEALGGHLSWGQLVEGLVKLIWDSLPLSILGLEVQGSVRELPLEAYRRSADINGATFLAFQELLKNQLLANPETTAQTGSAAKPPDNPPLPHTLWHRIQVGNVTLMAGAGRFEPFTPEESELFHIFILQGEAGAKNLVLFDKVKSMAIRDALTGLYNYGYFIEALHYEVEKCRRYNVILSLMFLDIDDFKTINDTLGHLQGDKIMRKVAAILKEGVRHADLLCRYGGDEFVLLLSQTSPGQAMVLAERLRQVISQSFGQDLEHHLKVTVSIGVAGLEEGMDVEGLIKAADEAHYRAKQAGKNCICGPDHCRPEDCNAEITDLRRSRH